MKLYLAAGQYVGTQAEAKKLDAKYEQVEVPTTKDELIAYLNSKVGVAVPGPDIGALSRDNREKELFGPRCPKCNLTPKGADRIAEGRINDLFAEKLDNLPDQSIVRATEIIVARILEKARTA